MCHKFTYHDLPVAAAANNAALILSKYEATPAKASAGRSFINTPIIPSYDPQYMYYSLKIVRQNVPLFMYPLLYPYSGLK